MFKRLLGVACLVVLSSGAAYAVDFGFRYGQFNDADEDFIGLDLRFPFATSLSFNPSFEYWLVDDDEFLGDVTIWTLNGDVNYDFNRGATVNPYLGAGVGFAKFDSDFGDDEETFLNINGGLEFQLTETFSPYIQARYFRPFDDEDDGDDIAFMVGLRF